MPIRPTYIYKMYDGFGNYLGLLPNQYIQSEFGYNQNIGTAFAQMQVTLALSPDTVGQANSAILDETGAVITDENSDPILDEGPALLVGDGTLIANNNLIKVYEITSFNPNGVIVFDGYVSKFRAIYGGSDTIVMTCISNGQDLSNHLVKSSQVLDQQQTAFEDFAPLYSGVPLGIAQAIVPGAGVTDVSSVTLKIAAVTTNNPTVIVKIFASSSGALSTSRFLSGLPGDAQASLSIPSTSPIDYSFTLGLTLPSPVPDFYVIAAYCSDGSGVNLYATDGGGYPAGSAINAGKLITALYFKTYHSSNGLSAPYTNQDPTAMLTDFMTNYINEGGLIKIQPGGYAASGISISYTFKIQTVLQAIQIIMTLLPSDWYWYVDPATDYLYVKERSTTADITLIRGRHIENLEIEATKENIKNLAYFTGGDDGTGTSTNIFVKKSSAQGSNRTGLALLNDNRVNSTTGGTVTAGLIASGNLAANSAETYITTVIVLAATLDLTTLALGKMLNFAGYDQWVAGLLLAIVGINRTADNATLQLGILPTRPTQAISQIQASLLATQTVANPSTPS